MNIPTELVIAYTPLVVVMAGLGVLLVDNAIGQPGHEDRADEPIEGEVVSGETMPLLVRRQP